MEADDVEAVEATDDRVTVSSVHEAYVMDSRITYTEIFPCGDGELTSWRLTPEEMVPPES